MSDEPELIETQLTLGIGATVSVVSGGSEWHDWVKPSVSYSLKWKGIPSEQMLRTATQFAQAHILNPIIEEIIVQAQARLDEARRNR
jgi:hypothetical protein